jgi:hypothetical protein
MRSVFQPGCSVQSHPPESDRRPRLFRHARWGSLAAAVSLALLGACGQEDVGTLNLDWTVLGGQDPGACEAVGADAMSIRVYDSADNVVASVDQPCEDFGYSFDLPEDDYRVEMVLVDSDGGAVSTTSHIEDLAVIGGTELDSGADFGSNTIRF